MDAVIGTPRACACDGNGNLKANKTQALEACKDARERAEPLVAASDNAILDEYLRNAAQMQVEIDEKITQPVKDVAFANGKLPDLFTQLRPSQVPAVHVNVVHRAPRMLTLVFAVSSLRSGAQVNG